MSKEESTKTMDSLGDRMKEYEAHSDVHYIPGYRNFIMRLDGNNFSKFTKGLPKPYDKYFSLVMVLTTNDLVKKYKPVTGYTHSDEITLIFGAQCTKDEYEEGGREKRDFIHNGKEPKLLSLVASYCSVRFNYHYLRLVTAGATNYNDTVNEKIHSMEAVFDARFVLFPEDREGVEIANHMIWRSLYDCYRNGSSTFADFYLGKKKTHGMSTKEKVMTMRDNKIVDFDKDVPVCYQHGSYVKKCLVEKEVEYVDGRTGETKKTMAKRHEFVNFTMKVKSDEPYINLLLSKNLEDESRDLVTVMDLDSFPYFESSFFAETGSVKNSDGK